MPRVTPCRVLKLLAWPWFIMLGLYFFLPSPAIPLHQREAYIQSRLAYGHTVITALDYTPFQKESRSDCYDCTDVLIHWRLVNSGRDVMLRSSDYDYDDGGVVNLTDVVRSAREWNEERWGGKEGEKWTPYFSGPLTMDGIPGGSTDEEINMPWFHAVDQKLIQYNMHNLQASIVAQAVVPEPGIVQIWRAAYVAGALNATAGPGDGEASTYDEMMLHKQDSDFLASFHLVESWENTLVVVKHLAGALPSRTYPLRRALLVPLGPFIAIPFILMSELCDFMSPFVWFIVAWMGLLVGFVGYRKMLESGNMPGLCWPVQFVGRWRRKNRRQKERRVWGPAGPVDVVAEGSSFDEEKGVGLRRPDNVRLGKL
ncbi:hypothetical protein CC86DRAFT_370241 [Ophiobolus disseminans]|uniref:Uncharacterized protein n=1 Tax=Ophiobolus disseminans TaxID=1469910 RepID=A0A6A7A052_9PLEO|nr:hypothetical protein CC86DRAFT_370241 [Ophiobolus disseminans]